MDDTTTRVPALVTALVAAVRNAVPSTVTVNGATWPVVVVDGPDLSYAGAPNIVVIGTGNDDGGAPYTSSVQIEGAGDGLIETGVVRCEAITVTAITVDPTEADPTPSVWAPARDRMQSWVAAIDAALRSDPDVASTVDHAYVSAHRWWQARVAVDDYEYAQLGDAFDITYVAHL